jgi:RNA polymerase sigma-70 factor (ECF subfamily)
MTQTLGDLLTAARAAWPNVNLADADASAFIVARVDPRDPSAAAHIGDLFIACACSRGDNTAIRALEARYFGDLRRALARMNLDDDTISEVEQLLRQQLFVGENGAVPRIAEYAGRGDLGGWLRVTAVRQAWKLGRKVRREVPFEVAETPVTTRSADPELGYMERAYRDSFALSFREALASLDPKERLLLKQHMIDGLTIDDLGALHNVHRATAARWIARAREVLLDRTRERFAVKAGIDKRECDSVLRLVQSRLDVTFRTLGGTGT